MKIHGISDFNVPVTTSVSIPFYLERSTQVFNEGRQRGAATALQNSSTSALVGELKDRYLQKLQQRDPLTIFATGAAVTFLATVSGPKILGAMVVGALATVAFARN